MWLFSKYKELQCCKQFFSNIQIKKRVKPQTLIAREISYGLNLLLKGEMRETFLGGL